MPTTRRNVATRQIEVWTNGQTHWLVISTEEIDGCSEALYAQAINDRQKAKLVLDVGIPLIEDACCEFYNHG